jgi:NAD(P)-dependent dehydrogenase (short-subunit alcohol dehydrogenase family)
MSQADFIRTSHATSYDFISPLQLDLVGKNVLITGGAWEDGVGYATATAYARAGASVIAIADLHEVADGLKSRLRSAATEAGRPEPLVISVQVDISDLGSVQALFNTLAPALNSRLDVLVNNAAVMEPYKTILDADPDVYWRTWEVNVRGLFNMARTFLPILLSSRNKGGLGTMINVSSSGALSARPKSSGYRSSKLAILRWTENIQADHGSEGLLTYCVNPGAIKTRITIDTPEEVRDRLPHRPDIAGDTIAWISAERRDWLAGRYVSCPWDMEEFMARKEEIVEGDKLKLRIVY